MAKLRFSYGTMNCGKSTLALQMEYNLKQAGKRGKLFTRLDRSGAVVSSRLGLTSPATLIEPGDNLFDMVRSDGLDYLIVDEVQFFEAAQIDQLGEIVDILGVDVHCYGISSDFTSGLFEGSKRLFEIADQCEQMQLKALCWCGEDGRVNARIVNGALTKVGEQVVVGDTGGTDQVHYMLLCRRHYREGRIS